MKTRADKYYILSPINHMEKWVEHNGKVICKFVHSLLRRFVETKYFFIIMSFFALPALLELDRPATLNKAVALVCLPKQGQSVSAGQYCTITGERVRFNHISHVSAGDSLLKFVWLSNLSRLRLVSSQGGVGQGTIVLALQSFKRLAFQWHSKTSVGLICDTGAQ